MKTLIAAFLFPLLAIGAIQKHALIVGLKYDDLLYGETDASSFQVLLKTNLGFGSDRVEYLVGELATREGILKAINRIGRRVRIDLNNGDQTLVYLYFSGHSVTDDTGRAFFLTRGSSPDVPSTGLSSDEFLREIKAQIPSERIVHFLDTCYAASAKNNGLSKSATRIAYPSIDSFWQNYLPRHEGLQMGYYSSSANEKSWEDPSRQHGIFTYYLLRGLRGEADQHPTGNADGVTTAGELKRYLEMMIPLHAKRLGHVQTPYPTPVFDYDLPLSSDDDYGEGLYHFLAPTKATDQMRNLVLSADPPRYVSISATGEFTILTNRQLFAPEQVLRGLANYRRTDPVSSVEYACLFPGGYFLSFSGGKYAQVGLPRTIESGIANWRASRMLKK